MTGKGTAFFLHMQKKGVFAGKNIQYDAIIMGYYEIICFFSAKYFVMSKKSITFAADFGNGTLPERLGIGLQNRGRRFESARYLRKRAAQESGSFLLDARWANGRFANG